MLNLLPRKHSLEFLVSASSKSGQKTRLFILELFNKINKMPNIKINYMKMSTLYSLQLCHLVTGKMCLRVLINRNCLERESVKLSKNKKEYRMRRRTESFCFLTRRRNHFNSLYSSQAFCRPLAFFVGSCLVLPDEHADVLIILTGNQFFHLT